MSYLIFSINGGIGKCIISTAVIEAFAEQRPDKKLIVVSGYPDVFINNPHVYRSFGFGNVQYFYETYIKGHDSEVFVHDPYNDTDFTYNRKHLIQIWIRLCGLEYNAKYQPKIYLTQREIDHYSSAFLNTDKPYFTIQTNGGSDNQPIRYSWMRDIPLHTAQQVVNHFKDRFNIVHIRRQDQFALENTVSITTSIRELAVFMSMTSLRLFMDSFAQHLASSLGLSSTVLWIGNSPKVFGYDINTNILRNEFTKQPEMRNSFLNEFNIVGEPVEFPYYSEADIFNVDEIIESLSKQASGFLDLLEFSNDKEGEEPKEIETNE